MARKAAGETRKRHRILIVDDHPIVRERLTELIHQEGDLEVCGEAEDSHQALRAVENLKPDLAIVDITLKDTFGIELIRQLHERWPKLPILVLSMHDEAVFGERSLRAGARGYLNKQEATRNVIAAIRKVLAGEIYASDKMASLILRKVAGRRSLEGGSPLDVLTDRELEVFQLLGQGLGVRQIAEHLFVSVKTVEAHREHIKRKLNVRTSAELLRLAFQYTMTDP
ncbi:MAG: response regulator transcription factor [Phycisphaerae bacterium]|nr:response regulator transcription factor [Phycisphaerae bacterium]MDW8263379.1 response regulator transcription factor [Phycisphaerales bacterium]